MKNKKNKNNPYVNGMSLEQIALAEAKYYYIQVGLEVPVGHSGKYTFTKNAAESIFWQMRESLYLMLDEGDEKEQKDSQLCLNNLRIHKLRIH